MTALMHARPNPDHPSEVTNDATTLVLEVRDAGDPVRLGRIVACLVNNSRMALHRVSVLGVATYPVAAGAVPSSDLRELTLTLRNRSSALDQLLVEEVVARVAARYRVVSARREP